MLLWEYPINEKREMRFYIHYMISKNVEEMKKIILRNKNYSEFFAKEYMQMKHKWFKDEKEISNS